ncbi:MAG: hypothetical protein FJY56_14295 [Betaproteobacteria bacterium]|nr:hypothetical protein [Betaproteobacteria bacterium]
MTRRRLQTQRGATLVIAMVMLVLLTLFALTAMNASNTNLRIASNAQTRAQLTAAIQQEIDKAISVAFTLNPTAIAGNKAVDVNGDGTVDYNVVVATPTCLSSIPIRNMDLNRKNTEDMKCFYTGINSLCSNTRWEISASGTDPISGATVAIRQGIGIRSVLGSC